MQRIIKATEALIDAIGTEGFAQTLSDALQRLAPFDYTVIFGYLGAARPMDLFDDFPRGKRKVFVEDYQEGPYLLDPFYLACGNKVEPGLYRIKDLAPDRFFQGEYFRSYYARTGLAEEIGYFIEMPGGATVVVSLMRAERLFLLRNSGSLVNSGLWCAQSASGIGATLRPGLGQMPRQHLMPACTRASNWPLPILAKVF